MFSKLRCIFGRHDWERGTNPEVSGPDATYFVCTRCGKEKSTYGGPTAGQATGMAAG